MAEESVRRLATAGFPELGAVLQRAVWLGSGDSVWLFGSGDSVWLLGSGDSVWLLGRVRVVNVASLPLFR